MPQLIIGALQKDAVHAKDGRCPRQSQGRGAGDGVLFCDSHIDELTTRLRAALGVETHDVGGAGAHGHHARIALDGVHKVRTGDLRVGGAGSMGACGSVGVKGEGPHVVPGFRIGFRRGKAGALFGVDVQDHGTRGVADLLQRANELYHVVALLKVAVIKPQRTERVVGRGAAGGTELGHAPVQAAVVFRDRLVVVVDDNDEAGV